MLQGLSLEFFGALEKQNRDELIGICAPLGLPIIIFTSCNKNLEIFFCLIFKRLVTFFLV